MTIVKLVKEIKLIPSAINESHYVYVDNEFLGAINLHAFRNSECIDYQKKCLEWLPQLKEFLN